MGTDEATRYEKFCQFKQQVRGSDSHLIVGIDVAKDRHHAFFGMPTQCHKLRRNLLNSLTFQRTLLFCEQLKNPSFFSSKGEKMSKNSLENDNIGTDVALPILCQAY